MSEESVRTDNYKLVLKPCECQGETSLDTRYFIDEKGELHCAYCMKKIEIVEFILFGCAKCGKASFREIDKIEKEMYSKNKDGAE